MCRGTKNWTHHLVLITHDLAVIIITSHFSLSETSELCESSVICSILAIIRSIHVLFHYLWVLMREFRKYSRILPLKWHEHNILWQVGCNFLCLVLTLIPVSLSFFKPNLVISNLACQLQSLAHLWTLPVPCIWECTLHMSLTCIWNS